MGKSNIRPNDKCRLDGLSTYQLSNLVSGSMVPCCWSSLSRCPFSTMEPSQMWMASGLHSSALSSMKERTFGDSSVRLPWTTLMPLRWLKRPMLGWVTCLARRPKSAAELERKRSILRKEPQRDPVKYNLNETK